MKHTSNRYERKMNHKKKQSNKHYRSKQSIGQPKHRNKRYEQEE